MSDRVVLDAAALDAINERLELAAWPGFTRISVGERDALIDAARENAALREALTELLMLLDDHECVDPTVERARLLHTDRTDGDDGAGIMHGVDW